MAIGHDRFNLVRIMRRRNNCRIRVLRIGRAGFRRRPAVHWSFGPLWRAARLELCEAILDWLETMGGRRRLYPVARCPAFRKGIERQEKLYKLNSLRSEAISRPLFQPDQARLL